MEVDRQAWGQYVLNHPHGTLFHLPGWSRAVSRAYGHRPVHLMAWSGRKMVGVLPLLLVKSVFVGRVLVSVPYGTYGGILADSHSIAEAILAEARRLAGELSVEYLELRNRDASGLDLPEIGRYDTFRKLLPDRPEDLFGVSRTSLTREADHLVLLGVPREVVRSMNRDHSSIMHLISKGLNGSHRRRCLLYLVGDRNISPRSCRGA